VNYTKKLLKSKFAEEGKEETFFSSMERHPSLLARSTGQRGRRLREVTFRERENGAQSRLIRNKRRGRGEQEEVPSQFCKKGRRARDRRQLVIF